MDIYRKLIWVAFLGVWLALLSPSMVVPQGGGNSGTQLPRNVALGFCALSSLGSATALSSCTTTTGPSTTVSGIPPGATYALICAYTQAVNYLDVNVAPTATIGTGGQGIPAGTCIPYTGGRMQDLQFIQQTASAIVGVSFYR